MISGVSAKERIASCWQHVGTTIQAQGPTAHCYVNVGMQGRMIKQNITSSIVPANMLGWSVMFHWLSCENRLNNCQGYFLKGSFTKRSQSNEVHSNEEVIDLCTHPHTLPPLTIMMDDPGDWVGEARHGEIHENPPVTSWDESGD